MSPVRTTPWISLHWHSSRQRRIIGAAMAKALLWACVSLCLGGWHWPGSRRSGRLSSVLGLRHDGRERPGHGAEGFLKLAVRNRGEVAGELEQATVQRVGFGGAPLGPEILEEAADLDAQGLGDLVQPAGRMRSRPVSSLSACWEVTPISSAICFRVRPSPARRSRMRWHTCQSTSLRMAARRMGTPVAARHARGRPCPTQYLRGSPAGVHRLG